ncbi:MAG TPA: glycine betaine ABC transporter substrate-binding protein [Spirochaetia bacterium]|nr:glycine betaine ABC transporter substrate-binding protein [Spirochaetia bacterium]
MRKRLFTLAVILVVGAATAFAAGQSEGASGAMKTVGTVKVGAKNFTEQYVMGQLISQLLQANGFKVSENFGMSSTVVRTALKTGQIDMYAEYTGTAWVTYMKQKTVINDPAKLFDAVKAEDLQKNQIVWLPMLPVNDTYALAVKQSFAQENNLNTLADLAALVNKEPNKVKFAVDPEFYQRPDGFFAMAKDYGMNVPKNQVSTMQIGLTYQAIDKGDVNVAMVFSTDGNLKKYNLKVLDDNKHFFPPYFLSVNVRKQTLDKYPQIAKILAPLAQKLTQADMVDMNFAVDAQKKEPKDVAKAFLQKAGLIKQ